MDPIRIGLIEDDPGAVTRLRRVIAAAGNGLELVHESGTARAAIDWLRVYRPDVLLVDPGLPDGSGLDVIREAARRYPDCDIVVISLFGDEAKVLESIEAGATGYLLKDASEAELPRHIQDLRAGGAPMSPVVARTILRRLKPAEGSAAKRPDPVNGLLTPSELEALSLVARGHSYAELGERTGRDVGAVKADIKHIYGKLCAVRRREPPGAAGSRRRPPPRRPA